MTVHGTLRGTGRGIDPKLIALADYLASKHQSCAILLARYSTSRQLADGSNGNEVWAIARDQKAVTLMWRRETQPKTLQAFRVAEMDLNHCVTY